MRTKKDKISIKNLRESKGYGARRLNQELPDKNRKCREIKKLVEKVARYWFA